MKKKIALVVVIILAMITIQPVRAEDSRIVECAVLVLEMGFVLIDDYLLNETLERVENYEIFQNSKLKLFIENGLNRSAVLWLPDFENDEVTRASNTTLKNIGDYLSTEFKVPNAGNFSVECSSVHDSFSIVVTKYVPNRFIQQPIFLNIISLPTFVLCGVFGMIKQKINDDKKKIKIDEKASEIVTELDGEEPLFTSPTKYASEEILDEFHKLKHTQNLPTTKEEIRKAFTETVVGWSFLIENPQELVKAEYDLPEKAKIKITEKLANEFLENIVRGNKASIDVALLLKQRDAALAQSQAIIGRQDSELRLIRSEKVNLELERNTLDDNLVLGDGSLISQSRINVEADADNIWSKFRPILISVGVFIVIAILIFLGIWIYNQIPTSGV